MAFDDQDQQVDLETWKRRVFEKHGVPEELRQSVAKRRGNPDAIKAIGLNPDDPWERPVATARLLRQDYDDVRRRNLNFSDQQAWRAVGAAYSGEQAGESEIDRFVRDHTRSEESEIDRFVKGQSAQVLESSAIRKATAPSRQKTTVRGPITPRQPASPFGLNQPGGFESAAQQVAARTGRIAPEVAAKRIGGGAN